MACCRHPAGRRQQAVHHSPSPSLTQGRQQGRAAQLLKAQVLPARPSQIHSVNSFCLFFFLYCSLQWRTRVTEHHFIFCISKYLGCLWCASHSWFHSCRPRKDVSNPNLGKCDTEKKGNTNWVKNKTVTTWSIQQQFMGKLHKSRIYCIHMHKIEVKSVSDTFKKCISF